MRDQINNRFKDIRQKWIYIPLKGKEFSSVLDDITIAIRNNTITSSEAIELIKRFKGHGKGWLKFISVRGRKNLYCSCEVITANNKKIKTALNCEFILNAELISGTPKSLKLYKDKTKRTSRDKAWKKPDDGFVDPITWPPVEEELTELGYELYKEWQLEIQASGLTPEAYKNKLFGYKKGFRVWRK